MATAMHEGTTLQKSIVWKKFHDVVENGYNKTDPDAVAEWASLCHDEAEEAYYFIHPEQKCFPVSVTVGARWAAEVLPKVSIEAFGRTRTRLCWHIAEGWLFSRGAEDEKQFAAVLRDWPKEEQKMAADVVRQVLEYRFPLDPKHFDNPNDRLLRFLADTELSPVETADLAVITDRVDAVTGARSVVRTVAKALGKYLPVHELVGAAKQTLAARNPAPPPATEPLHQAKAKKPRSRRKKRNRT